MEANLKAARLMRYFIGRWNETPGCDEDQWGHSWWFFEISPEGYPLRQVILYDKGPRLRYGPEHVEDMYGFLSNACFDDSDISNLEAVSRDEFERAWESGNWSNC